MKTTVQKITLIGGTNDGVALEVYAYQPTVCMPKQISAAERSELKIDGVICWKGPEEVYERQPNEIFSYRNTVNYKP